MRKVIVANFVSLDGFMAGPKGEIDWFVADEGFFDYAKELLTKVDTILFGRVTYEGMANYWPTVTSADDVMASKMNGLEKVVFSKTLNGTPWGNWNNARQVKDNISAEITKLKQQSGKDMVIYGSASIASELTQLGLIDEYQLVICPVVLGSGIRQFDHVDHTLKLNLLKTTPFKCGSVLMYYAPAK